MRFSSVSAAFVACIVGFGGTVALVLAAAQAVGATPAQTASWVTMLCAAIAAESLYLSWRHKMPIVTAWSSPSLALVGASTGFDIQMAVGAFVMTGILLFITGLMRPLSRFVERIPAGISAGMLAGVILPFVIGGAEAAGIDIWLVLPLTILFFLVRVWNPSLAVIAVLVTGILWAFISGQNDGSFEVGLSTVEFIRPEFSIATFIGLSIPLYLVGMASQNLPGLAVIRASGYNPPIGSPIAITGLGSIMTAFFGASSTCLAAITAAICTGEESHPDPKKRWQVGIWYAVFYSLFGLFGASLVGLISIMPPALMMLVTGLALLGPLANAISIALAKDDERIAGITTFAITASSIAFYGVGAPFWGLAVGLLVYYSARLKV
ncbi:MAG: benzoate/H(+) symporter BenE family transporter [Pseudomonadota bacterium]